MIRYKFVMGKYRDKALVFQHFSNVGIGWIIMAVFLVTGFTNALAQQSDSYENFGAHFGEKLQLPSYIIPNGPYQPNWNSLDKHDESPKWFRDAKFGIYFHWGVYSVPAFDSEWYPRNMYNKKGKVYKHHVATYGSPLKFGYPDFVPMFKAEHFDADAWAKLFKQAGARFAGPVAEHHDGFSMWDSDWTPWNAMDKGPHQDIVGELEKAIRKQGMRFITTFHHSKNNLWKKDGKWTGHYTFVNEYFPSLLKDPERAIMYGDMPRKTFLQMWRGKLEEVVNKYHPDIMWFDYRLGFIPDSVKTKYLAYYFNKADQWGKDVVVTSKHKQFPDAVGVEDFEKGRTNKLTKNAWLTDDTISKGSWCYTQDLEIKSTTEVLHTLIDIVSKNGQLLLNISPKADGTIPENQKDVLRGMGNWLDQNGEAIYGTRPWKIFGEGPTRLKKGGAFVKSIQYNAKDIRFTTKGDTLYAIDLAWPGQEMVIHSLAASRGLESRGVGKVTYLATGKKLNSHMESDGLHIEMPEKQDEKFAYAVRIEFR